MTLHSPGKMYMSGAGGSPTWEGRRPDAPSTQLPLGGHHYLAALKHTCELEQGVPSSSFWVFTFQKPPWKVVEYPHLADKERKTTRGWATHHITEKGWTECRLPQEWWIPNSWGLGGSQGGIRQDSGCLVIATGSKAQMHVDTLPHAFSLGPTRQQRGHRHAVAGQGWVALPAPATHCPAGWDTRGLRDESGPWWYTLHVLLPPTHPSEELPIRSTAQDEA